MATAPEESEDVVLEGGEVTYWKAQLLERAADEFTVERGSAGVLVHVKELHAKIRQLALENDLLVGGILWLSGPSV